MSTVRIGTNFNIDIEFTAPPFYRRLLAWVIDIIILIFYVVIAFKFLSWCEDQIHSGVTLNAIELLLMLPFILYHVVLETTMNGQSIGKKIMGIKVISENGGRPSVGQFIIRWLIRTSDSMLLYLIILIILISAAGMSVSPQLYGALVIAVVFLITDLILVNTRKQQRLGDILARTVLINTRQKEKLTDTVFLEVSDKYIPQFPQIMQLSDRDMNALKGIIDTSKKHKDHNMAFMASEKIKAHLKIDTHLDPEDFLEVLLKDYNYLSVN